MKKLTSVLLAALMLLTLAIPAFAAEKQGTDIPNVYLQGQGAHIVLPNGTVIFDGGDLPDGFLGDAVKECMPLFIDAMKNDDQASWDAYRAKLMELLRPVIGGYALDKNGDGEINDGTELFGTRSGDGFKELSAHDTDRDGWIDEDDDIFDKLKVWVRDPAGDRLLSLKDAGIGAINLMNCDTEFSLKNETNKTNAMVRSTGMFLFEDGRAGTVQQIDLVS